MKSPRLLLAALLLAPALLHAQGTFPPPSAPGVPLMKTLTQVEPRTPIQTLSAAAPYNITQPGSYYLTGNITVATDISAIIVATGVDDVTIDLSGFTIESTLATAGTTVAISFGNSARVTIRNGSIKSGSTVSAGVNTKKGFLHGIYSVGGSLTNSIISGVKIVGMGGTGIYCQSGSLVENCNVSHCTDGINNPTGSTTRHCIVTSCSSSAISATPDGVVEGCNGTGYSGAGIYATTAVDSIGTSNSNAGIVAKNATNCSGTSTSDNGLIISNATNCIGISISGIGFSATTATNCTGTSTSSIGLSAINATNCTGASTTGTGLSATNATNCTGTTSSNVAGIYGLIVSGTANTCRGVAGGAVATALKAAIAIGCTYGPGLLTVPAGKTFNM